MQFSIVNRTRKPAPRLPYEKIKDAVLGKNYELSLVFCADVLSRRLNRTYRQKDYATNILSFPIDKNSGEIFIDLRRLKGFTVGHLFIHGLFHLKGLDHGDTMETAEEKVRKTFRI